MPSAILLRILVVTWRTAKAFSRDLYDVLHQQLDDAYDADTILGQKAAGTENLCLMLYVSRMRQT